MFETFVSSQNLYSAKKFLPVSKLLPSAKKWVLGLFGRIRFMVFVHTKYPFGLGALLLRLLLLCGQFSKALQAQFNEGSITVYFIKDSELPPLQIMANQDISNRAQLSLFIVELISDLKCAGCIKNFFHKSS